MFISKVPIFIFLVSLISSCNSSKKSEDLAIQQITEISVTNLGHSKELKKTGEITIQLDDRSTYEMYNVRYVEHKDGEYLYVLNSINASVDVYSLNDGDLVKRISYQTEGPDGIEQVQGFTVANEDSIFLFPKFKLVGTLLLDGKGKVINRFNPEIEDPEIRGHINHISGNSNQTYFFGNSLYFHRYAFSTIKNPEFIYDFSFDIVNHDSQWLSHARLPDIYLEKEWFSYYYTDSRLALNEKEWVYSWSILDSLIYVRYDNGNILKKMYYAGDAAMLPPLTEPENTDQAMYYQLVSQISFYGQILCSPGVDQFWRLLYLKPRENSELRQGESSIFFRNFILIALDRDFNIQNKTLFESGMYDPRVMFAGRKGVYIPRINPLYSGLSENQVTYDIYAVSQ